MHLIPENPCVTEPQIIHVGESYYSRARALAYRETKTHAVHRRNGVNVQRNVPERLARTYISSASHNTLNLDSQTPSPDSRGNNAPIFQTSAMSDPFGHTPHDGNLDMHPMAILEENNRLADAVMQLPMVAETNMTSSTQSPFSSVEEQVTPLMPMTTPHRYPRTSLPSSPMHGSLSHCPEIAQPLEESSGQTVEGISALQTLLLPDAAYPEYILDTLAYTSDLPPSRQNFYSLWTYMLEYWFPSTEGFEVVQDWNPNISFGVQEIMINCEPLPKARPSLAVFDSGSPTQPFLLVNIHNGMLVNDLSRTYAKRTLEESFETLRACSFRADFRALCVVSAVGARWNMVLRDAGWVEDEGSGGSDYVGELEEDATSPESYRVMGYCFGEIKRNLLCRRQKHVQLPVDIYQL